MPLLQSHLYLLFLFISHFMCFPFYFSLYHHQVFSHYLYQYTFTLVSIFSLFLICEFNFLVFHQYLLAPSSPLFLSPSNIYAIALSVSSFALFFMFSPPLPCLSCPHPAFIPCSLFILSSSIRAQC